MKRKIIRILTVFFTLLLMRSALSMEKLNLIPMPREVKFIDGVTTLSGDWVICLVNENIDDVYSAELLVNEAENCFQWNWKIIHNVPEKNFILITGFVLKDDTFVCYDGSVLSKDEPDLFKEQGYFLTIESDKIVIEAFTETGRFYGVQTLRQIIRTTTGQDIPQLKVKDYPALKWRGISDDISRGQVSMVDDFKEIISQLAFYKKNIYQPYIEDMFTFAISPNIGRDRGAITKEEMAQMVEEAKKNHIVLTPVFECLGHQDRLLSLPENRKYAEIQDTKENPWSFSPVNQKAFEFVTKLIDELAEATPSPFFHIGGDESFDVGKGTGKKKVKKMGVGRVHAEYFSKLCNYIKEKHNRRMMVYSDMLLRHPEALDFLPKDVILIDWHYGLDNDFPSVKKLKDAGFRNIIASPAIWSWASFYPNYYNGTTNVSNFTKIAKQEKLLGCITSSWGDDGAENLRENNLLGYSFSASAEWEEETPDVDAFLSRYVAIRYGIESQELAEAEKLIGWVDYFDMANPGQLFHRPVRIRQYDEKLIEKMNRLEKDMQRALQLIDNTKDKVRFDKEHLKCLELCAFRYYLMAYRYRRIDALAKMLTSKKFSDYPDWQQKGFVEELEILRRELLGVINKYQQLWLKRNKYPKLDFNLERFQKQVSTLSNLIVLANAGSLQAYYEEEAVWFWYPDEDPKKNASKGNKYFVRVFELEKEPISAQIKCWADDKATIFLNGEKVLEASYGDPAVTQNVLPFLTSDKNILAVEGYNYIGSGGMILKLTVNFSDGTKFYITGDEKWKVSNQLKWRWKNRIPRGKKWQNVKLLGKGLIKPWENIDW